MANLLAKVCLFRHGADIYNNNIVFLEKSLKMCLEIWLEINPKCRKKATNVFFHAL